MLYRYFLQKNIRMQVEIPIFKGFPTQHDVSKEDEIKYDQVIVWLLLKETSNYIVLKW